MLEVKGLIFVHRKLGGTRWASGKAGPLNSHAQDVLKKKSSKPDKVRKPECCQDGLFSFCFCFRT